MLGLKFVVRKYDKLKVNYKPKNIRAMTLIRYENRLPVLMRRLFEGESELWDDKQFSTSPATNIIDRKDDFLIEIAAPGYQKQDFNIELDQNYLTVSAERKQDKNISRNETYIRKEFNYHDFKHTFSLSDWVIKNKIDANYENGILRVSIPKREEIKPQSIKKIKVN